MVKRMARRLGRLTCGLALLVCGGCVDAFAGSWVEFVLGGGVAVPAGDDNLSGVPPSNTHFEMWVLTGNVAFKIEGGDFQVASPEPPLAHRAPVATGEWLVAPAAITKGGATLVAATSAGPWASDGSTR